MEKSMEDFALLVGGNGPLNGERWAIREDALIGRDYNDDIVIPDRQVSRYHARLTLTPEGVLLEDLGSKNGTHLNGERIEQPVLLQDGDVIQIALAQQFTFLSSDATLPLNAGELQDSVPLPQAKLTEAQQASSGHLRLDAQSRQVFIQLPSQVDESYQEIELSPALSAAQFNLLQVLYDNQGKVVPRARLIAEIWGAEQAVEVSEQALDALVRRLRVRLSSLNAAHEYIITLRGHGLRFENPGSA